MGDWMVIIDKNQGEGEYTPARCPLVLTDDNDDPATFDSVEEIEALYKEHPLNVFGWWAFDWTGGGSSSSVTEEYL